MGGEVLINCVLLPRLHRHLLTTFKISDDLKGSWQWTHQERSNIPANTLLTNVITVSLVCNCVKFCRNVEKQKQN